MKAPAEQKVFTFIGNHTEAEWEKFFYTWTPQSLQWHMKNGWFVKYIMANEPAFRAVVILEKPAGDAI